MVLQMKKKMQRMGVSLPAKNERKGEEADPTLKKGGSDCSLLKKIYLLARNVNMFVTASLPV